MKNKIFPLIFLTMFFPIFAQEAVEKEQEEKPTLIKKISDINMRSFPWRDESWDCNTYVEYVKFAFEYITNPTPRRKRANAFTFFQTAEKNANVAVDLGIDPSATWKDLDLYCGKSEQQKYVANILDRTSTEIGKISFYSLLAQTTTNTQLLEQRQQIISLLKKDSKLAESLQNCFDQIKDAENILLNFWDKDHFKHMSEHYLFPKMLTFLNKSESLLFVKNSFKLTDMLIGTAFKTVTSVALIAYGVLHATNLMDVPKKLEEWVGKNYQTGVGMSGGYLTSFLWDVNNRWLHAGVALFLGIGCLSTLKYDYDGLYGSYLHIHCLQALTANFSKVAQNMKDIYEWIRYREELVNFEEFKALQEFYEKEIQANGVLEEVMDLLQKGTFKSESSIFCHNGVLLRTYILVHELKEKFEQALVSVARLDAYFSVSKLIKEHEGKTVDFCFPQFQEAEKPFIKIDNFWHPLIEKDKIITNSVVLGTEGKRANVVLTGPNEGGKSTILKAITLCLILAQTVGVVPAKSMIFTPFNSIATYLNITDDIGSGNSLFKAEVLRAQQLLEKVRDSKENEFNFAVFDEMFNGTSPVEGSAAAYSVAKHLAEYENSICMVATHFPLLTQLEDKTKTFSNYKVSVIKNRDGSIGYPYKLENGISTQHVALDILQNQGFASAIISDAQEITDFILNDRAYNPMIN